jgi:hypothetical protein
MLNKFNPVGRFTPYRGVLSLHSKNGEYNAVIRKRKGVCSAT